ncbi:MAG: hypothetical protein ACKOJF_21750, partial [Planctomycetaceae bacterium]
MNMLPSAELSSAVAGRPATISLRRDPQRRSNRRAVLAWGVWVVCAWGLALGCLEPAAAQAPP